MENSNTEWIYTFPSFLNSHFGFFSSHLYQETQSLYYLRQTPHFLSLPPFFAPEPTIQLCSETKNGYGSMGLQTHHTHPRTSLHNRLNRRPPRETPVKTPLTDLPGKNYVFNYSKYTMVGPSILTWNDSQNFRLSGLCAAYADTIT